MKTTIAFPSPRRGPIFSTRFIVIARKIYQSFRPHEGDPSSLLILALMKGGVICFRPHEGDPSSLRDYDGFYQPVVVTVSVPTKGTHLLYIVTNLQRTVSKNSVSVPTKGTHLLYPVRAIHEFSHNYSPLFVVKENRYYFHWSLS